MWRILTQYAMGVGSVASHGEGQGIIHNNQQGARRTPRTCPADFHFFRPPPPFLDTPSYSRRIPNKSVVVMVRKRCNLGGKVDAPAEKKLCTIWRTMPRPPSKKIVY
jgi:hypothetical protein